MNLTHQGTGEAATSQGMVKRGKLDAGHDVKKSEQRLIHLSRKYLWRSPHRELCLQCMYQTELV